MTLKTSLLRFKVGMSLLKKFSVGLTTLRLIIQ